MHQQPDFSDIKSLSLSLSLELNNTKIMESLKNKSILITGSTGFLAKLFAEKVLRYQPNVKQLYLLVRASNTDMAKQRIENEVVQMDVLKVMRETYQGCFSSYFWSKVTPVVGDIALENFGIRDHNLLQLLLSEVDIIINSAATTNFNERYDVALGINTFGAKHVLMFAKRCVKLEMLLHVSTAYSTNEKEGVVLEKALAFKEGSEEFSILNIKAEMKLVEEKLKELKCNAARGEDIRLAMKELGTERAAIFGWPNTYTFTKAMGEILIYELRGDLPIVILRPTIITSTYKEPFPGWIEGVRTVDLVIVGYGTGQLTSFPGNPNTILDMVPGDMVVNAMSAAIAMHSCQPSLFIYQVGSSVSNPTTLKTIYRTSHQYFSTNPQIGRDGRPIIVGRFFFFPTLASFDAFMTIRHKILLLILWLLGVLFFSHGLKKQYGHLNRKYYQLKVVARAYRPYTLLQRSFDDCNLQKLRVLVEEKDNEAFGFDTRCINWDHYLVDVHIPGLLKYGMEEKTKS